MTPSKGDISKEALPLVIKTLRLVGLGIWTFKELLANAR
jgi:hypothetical protein